MQKRRGAGKPTWPPPTQQEEYSDMLQKLTRFGFRAFMLSLGPLLVVLAVYLISFVLYVGTTCVLPLYGGRLNPVFLFSTLFTVFLGFNIVFNYFLCVTTNPGSHDSEYFKELVEKAKSDGNIQGYYDDKLREEDSCADDIEKHTEPKIRKRPIDSSPQYAEVHGKTVTTINSPAVRDGYDSEDEFDPFEWTYCWKSNGPKPPRSHFDSVTNKLVLNMDHYCPWMFNVVGFRNYRYFFLFLLWLWVGCVYAIIMTIVPFFSIRKHREVFGIIVPKKDSANVSFMFIICCAICFSISFLFFWHLYLILTGQTTIEYHINRSKKREGATRGHLYMNPYDMGRRKNWQHVMGTMGVLKSLLPSTREPPGLPWPDFGFLPMKRRQGAHAV